MYKILKDISSMSMNPQEVSAKNQNLFSITELPPHLIEKILGYCYRDRHQLKSVCKGFYEAINKIYEDKFHWKFHVRDLANEKSDLIKMLSTQPANCRRRNFPSIEIPAYGLPSTFVTLPKEFLKFFEINGATIQNLTLHLDAEKIRQLIVHAPNITKISLDYIVYKPEKEIFDLSELKNLKELTLLRCCKMDLKNIKLMKNALELFKIQSYEKLAEVDIRKFILDQSAIKNVEFDIDHLKSKHSDPAFHKHLQLEEASLQYDQNTRDRSDPVYINIPIMEKLIDFQVNLRVLKLGKGMTDDILNKITENLKHLEEFRADFSRVDYGSFSGLEKLKKLEILEIFNTGLDSLFSERAKGGSFSVTTLYLRYCRISCEYTAKYIARRLPKLKIIDSDEKVEMWKMAINGVFQHQRELEEARFFNIDTEEYGHFKTFILEPFDLINEKLTVLVLQYQVVWNMEFLRNFPNLIELDLTIDVDNQNCPRDEFRPFHMKEGLESIATGFPKLRKLFLTFSMTFPITFDNLEFIHGIPRMELVFFANVYTNRTTIEMKKLKRYEVAQVRTHSILLATDAKALVNSKKNFLRKKTKLRNKTGVKFGDSSFDWNFENVYYETLHIKKPDE